MIALYKGTSSMSRLIRWATWSQYSHAAWINDQSGQCIQAWRAGVVSSRSFSEGHKPGTAVDFFSVRGEGSDESSAIESVLNLELGKSYDVAGILGFVIRRDRQNQDRWFCSELVFHAYECVGLHLLSRVPPCKVFPGMLAISPLLKHEYSMTTI